MQRTVVIGQGQGLEFLHRAGEGWVGAGSVGEARAGEGRVGG